MSRHTRIVTALLFITTAVSLSSFANQTADIEVSISNVRSQQGSVLVSVFNDKDSKAFPEGVEKAVVKLKLTVAQSEKFIIENLPAGDYAIAVLHDEDDNGQMNKAGFPIKIPKEGFGFSNNKMKTFGPPSFEMSKVTVAAPVTQVSIRMKHMKGLSVK